MTRELDRRRTLQLGAGATALALAGCIGGDDENGGDNGGENGELFEGDVPEYTQYLDSDGTSTDGLLDETTGEIFLMYIDYDGLEQLEEFDFGEQGNEGPQANPDEAEGSTDGLLASPSGAFGFLFTWGFAVAGTGLEAVTSTDESNGQEDELETEIQAQIFANDAVVLQGEIDTEEVGDLLENPPKPEDSDNGFAPDPRPFEFVESVDDYDIYRSSETNDEGNRQSAAVGSDEILYGSTQTIVEEAIETTAGERERAVDAFDDLGRVLGPAAEEQMVFAGYDEDGLEANEGDQTSIAEIDNSIQAYVSGASFDDDGMDAVAAILAADPAGDDTESVIRDKFGTDAEDVQFEFSGRGILVTGRYSNETLQNI